MSESDALLEKEEGFATPQHEEKQQDSDLKSFWVPKQKILDGFRTLLPAQITHSVSFSDTPAKN